MKNSSLTVTLSNESVQVLLDALLHEDRFKWRSFRHCNAEFELHIILSGSCALDVEGHVCPLSTGDAIMILPNSFHSAHRVTDAFERLSLGLVAKPGSYIAQLLRELSRRFSFRLTQDQLELCRLLIREANAGDLYHNELCHAYLTALLITVFRICNPDFISLEKPSMKWNFQRRHVVDTFFSSWPTPVGSEEELAQRLHLSRRQVARFLKQNYGMSFREKHMRSRMDYAAWLLRSTDQSLSDIAQQVNYSSEYAFFGAFKKHFEITPTEYRQKNQM